MRQGGPLSTSDVRVLRTLGWDISRDRARRNPYGDVRPILGFEQGVVHKAKLVDVEKNR